LKYNNLNSKTKILDLVKSFEKKYIAFLRDLLKKKHMLTKEEKSYFVSSNERVYDDIM
jgi:hypothetical protein